MTVLVSCWLAIAAIEDSALALGDPPHSLDENRPGYLAEKSRVDAGFPHQHTLGGPQHAVGHDGGYGTGHNSPEQHQQLSYTVHAEHTFHNKIKSPDQKCPVTCHYHTADGPKKSRIKSLHVLRHSGQPYQA